MPKLTPYSLYNEDCFETFKRLKDQSIDLVLVDPPYGTTDCNWDSVIPLEPLWKELKRVAKREAAIVVFGTEPFSSILRLSNLPWFKYDWIWHKSKCGSSFTAKYRPLQKHETISVFCRGKTNYYPIMKEGEPYYRLRQPNKNGAKPNNHKLGVVSLSETVNSGFRYPDTVIFFQQKWRRQDQVHPTQKPIELMEYLINTYTKPRATVLDFAMGSGPVGVACMRLDRKYVGCDVERGYFKVAQARIKEAYRKSLTSNNAETTTEPV